MDAATPIHSGRTYTVLVVLLAGLIALGAMLVVLVTGGGRISSASFEVAAPEAVECPFGSGAPVCYRYNVTNTGDAPSFVRCELTPAGDSTAVFGNGSTSYESPIEMAATDVYRVYVQIEAGPSGEVTSPPMVGCAPVA
jgi:hypothetical protein